jgi:D-alanyl-lipoteichoic acid acyltransferase DltB (MBOAT superfamily)
MLFNSFEFIFLFLPVSVIGFHLLRGSGRRTLALDWLIVCSLLFYSWGNPRNLPVLLASLLFNYGIARAMGSVEGLPAPEQPNLRRKRLFVFGVAANLVLLTYYKYSNHLPLGVSFWTLMQVMYLVDCYEGMVAPNTLREHTLLASFFPTVAIGPIVRAKPTVTQFRALPAVDADQLARAVMLFCMGLFKKAVIADSFARIANAGYADPGTLPMLDGWVCAVAYMLQLYFDFSGYTDMAVAAAMMLGFAIPINFNSPYHARSIIDYWKRWHMSLSNFITTYIYTPIVRSFKKLTFAKAMWATFISMLIAGFWHGSTWNFIIFGGIHGAGLVINHNWKKRKIKLPGPVAWLLTMGCVLLGSIFFRARTTPDALALIASLGKLGTFGTAPALLQSLTGLEVATVVIGIIVVCLKRNSNQIIKEFTPTWKNLSWVSLTILVSIVYLNSNMSKEFLYFDF